MSRKLLVPLALTLILTIIPINMAYASTYYPPSSDEVVEILTPVTTNIETVVVNASDMLTNHNYEVQLNALIDFYKSTYHQERYDIYRVRMTISDTSGLGDSMFQYFSVPKANPIVAVGNFKVKVDGGYRANNNCYIFYAKSVYGGDPVVINYKVGNWDVYYGQDYMWISNGRFNSFYASYVQKVYFSDFNWGGEGEYLPPPPPGYGGGVLPPGYEGELPPLDPGQYGGYDGNPGDYYWTPFYQKIFAFLGLVFSTQIPLSATISVPLWVFYIFPFVLVFAYNMATNQEYSLGDIRDTHRANKRSKKYKKLKNKNKKKKEATKK